ncbi:hypothetical protein DEJ50_03660 [Streptomyces venezuelae]|uniref:Uncharacterized protein n=1 Tax=Streptomyces venezuelae TaxID=54571 RepID=A0A5P2CW50_STRVZ|nr:hypothetical protein DEJ50_03660 [Streptomyces venezuelae]
MTPTAVHPAASLRPGRRPSATRRPHRQPDHDATVIAAAVLTAGFGLLAARWITEHPTDR